MPKKRATELEVTIKANLINKPIMPHSGEILVLTNAYNIGLLVERVCNREFGKNWDYAEYWINGNRGVRYAQN